MKPTRFLKMLLAVMATAGAARATTPHTVRAVLDDITRDTTWRKNVGTTANPTNATYMLSDVVFVTDGATLTIEPGVVVRGAPGNWAVQDPPGALVVSRGAKIHAVGTVTQPIIFTSAEDSLVPYGATPAAPWTEANNGITGQWGGLLLLGRTYLAARPSGAPLPPHKDTTLQIEGLIPYGEKSRYGGGNDDDNSGELRYIQIRYGGFIIGANNEINGLTMGAVGRGTRIAFVDVYNNKDDAVEWFGGTVNTKYLVTWVGGDDHFDWDEGFRGKGQFWLAVQGTLHMAGDVGDKGGELDGALHGDANQPSSIATVYNATMIGLGRDTGAQRNTALNFRDGTGGRWYNSMFLDFGGAACLIEDHATAHSAGRMTTLDYGDFRPTGATPNNNAGAAIAGYIGYNHGGGGKMLELTHNYFGNLGWNDSAHFAAGSGAMGDTWGAESGDRLSAHLDYAFPHSTFGTYSMVTNAGVVLVAPGGPLFYARTDIVRTVGGRNYRNIMYLTAGLEAGSPWLTAGRAVPANDDFFTPVNFVGAFGRRNWLLGWTTAAAKGLVASEPGVIEEGDYENLAPAGPVIVTPAPTIGDIYRSITIEFGTIDGVRYAVEASGAATFPTSTVLGQVTGTGANVRFTDLQKMGAARFYRVRPLD